jgi:hypothetical protein
MNIRLTNENANNKVLSAGSPMRKSTPLKPLGQFEPNFSGMVLGWPPSNLCPVIPTSNQDGHQAKNRKKGG